MSVCKDFESYFVEQVLKSMEKMAKIDSEDEDSNLFSSMAGIGGTAVKVGQAQHLKIVTVSLPI